MEAPRFLVDQNVGKLVRWLRLLGYDAVFFAGETDTQMVKQALAENRILLTRDTAIQLRKVAVSGKLLVITFDTENPEAQMRQLLTWIPILDNSNPFTRCLEDNTPLKSLDKIEVEKRVPPYTFKTQDEFMECPMCCRVYWRGSHWRALESRLARFRTL